MNDWFATKGRTPPNPDAQYWVRFRNGHESKQPYAAKQLIWHDRGQPFDIVAARRV